MKLIAGLGNPGVQYAFTRHNMGWLCIDHFVQNHNLGDSQEKFHAEFWKKNDVIFLKPLTFMNSSGLSIIEAVNFYKIALEDILIIYDDMALPFGKLRMRMKGSAGGHNGMISIIGALGDMNFPRLRVGIGKAPSSMINYVLGHFDDNERNLLPKITDLVQESIETWLNDGIEKAMLKTNTSNAINE